MSNKEILQDILDCKNAVNDLEFNGEEKDLLAELERKGHVQKAWMVTSKGKKFLEFLKGEKP